MSENKKKDHKHLTISQRLHIEKDLENNESFSRIAKRLEKDPSTISKEVRRHRMEHVKRDMNHDIPCANRQQCRMRSLCSNKNCIKLCKSCTEHDFHCTKVCPDYLEKQCDKLVKPPYVCNGCQKKPSCLLRKSFYSAKYADDCYRDLLISAREGINQAPVDIAMLDALISPLLKKGQSLAHIYAHHAAEIPCCRKTLYNYIDKSVFTARNIDLRRRVRYKVRKSPTRISLSAREFRIGRTYDEFQKFMKENPNNANDCYRNTLVSSRVGINQTPESIQIINNLIVPLIKDKHQSIAHVYATHSEEIGCSRRTLYGYIDAGVFDVRNIDLRRAVRYKKRKKKTTASYKDRTYRKGHNYEDFQKYMKEHPGTSVVEMDCVEGVKGGKVLLTLTFRSCNLMLIFLLENQDQECVLEVFIWLETALGQETFKKIFPVILTDGGSEFSAREEMEEFCDGTKSTTVYYCDPYSFWQKGACEKNHEYIRYVLPKGSSFNELTGNQVNKLMNHINSEKRDSLNGHSPYELSLLLLDNRLHKGIPLVLIPPDEVNLDPGLLK